MEQLLQTIRYNDGKFPHDALQQIIEHKEEAVPHLLQIMRSLKEDYTQVIDRPARIDFVYAYFLLAQFRVKELFPIMVDILSMPSDVSEHILGDGIAEDTGRILASVYNGDIDLLLRLIENPEANEYARGQALIALVALVFNGQLSREFVMNYFKQLMNERHEDAYSYLNAEIVLCCNDLYPEEVYSDIQRLYEERAIDTGIVSMNSIEKTLKKTKEKVLQENQHSYKYQLITDTIGELQGWACFQGYGFNNSANSASIKDYGSVSDEPKRNPAVKVEKVGRNDPCTCGSGQKYKKCCGK